jgi:hypothetical protein
MKNAVFWDIKIPFVPHRRHIMSPLQSTATSCDVKFEVFTAVTMKYAVFWGVMLRGSCKNRRFEGTYRLHRQGKKNEELRTPLAVTSNKQLATRNNVVPS